MITIEMEIVKKLINNEIPIESVDENAFFRTLILGIGTIIEEEDKIICKVEQEKLDKYIEATKGIDIGLRDLFHDVELTATEQKDFLDQIGVNKPIYYIFEGITFNKSLKLSSSYYSVNAVFRNCFFKDTIYLLDCDNVEFKDNKYIKKKSYFNDECYFSASKIGKLTFKDDNFVNVWQLTEHDIKLANLLGTLPCFGMNVTNAKEIEFIDTRVEASYPISINADTIRLENSTLDGVELGLNAKNIENKDSSIKATQGVIIDNQDCDFVGTIESPLIFYNGEEVTNYNSTTTLVSKQQLLRVGLIDALDQIREKSTNQIIEEALNKDTRGVGDIMGLKPYTRKKVPQDKSVI